MTNFIDTEFGIITDLIRQHAMRAPNQWPLVQGERHLDDEELDKLLDRTACALQLDGVRPGDAIAICVDLSIEYAAIFLGALRAGVVVAPLAPGSGAASLQRMVQDARAKLVFLDGPGGAEMWQAHVHGVARIALDNQTTERSLKDWLTEPGQQPVAVAIQAG